MSSSASETPIPGGWPSEAEGPGGDRGASIRLLVEELPHRRRLALIPEVVVVAGYTGRDPDRVQKHIDELARAGIPRPPTVPAFYPVSPRRLTGPATTLAAAPCSSGEVEPVLVVTPQGRWLGIGSDHTDRALERVDVAESKRRGPKVIGGQVIAYQSIADHWDRLLLRSFADGRLYQEGRLGDLLKPEDLLARALRALGRRPAALVLFMGTVALNDGAFRYAREFVGELSDPDGELNLRLCYRVDLQRGDSDENR
jgi:hypothetical protein